MKKDEYVDILQPPTFEKTGIIKTKEEAYDNGDWIATFNLWIVRTKPKPAILFQLRSKESALEANKLDVTSGGHYRAGESLYNGLREVKEELGKKYFKKDLINLGRRVYLGIDNKNRLRHNIVYVFAIIDNSPLASFKLQKQELDGLFICPISDLIKTFAQKDYKFKALGINNSGKSQKITVSLTSFPYNFDNYIFKAVLVGQRILNGEKYVFI